MDNLILKTKLTIPVQPQRAVYRSQLVEALEGEIHHYNLILVSSPAGYGKTTLLSQWAHQSRFPIVWLSISEEDNNLERLLRYLITGWEKVQPGVQESPLGVLMSGRLSDSETALSAFINTASESPSEVVFVLDDYHLISEESVHEALTFLLDHTPPGVHFVLASRGDPPLPIARYRARGELLEFRASDLSFTLEESKTFLSQGMGLELAPGETEQLQVQLEGWIAGFQLVALATRRVGRRTEQPVVSGRQRFVTDYLSEEVLDRVPLDIRQFLLKTSILDRMCSTLCEAVTGEKESQKILETLERDDLFLIPLDENREWFRYHRLFVDFLRAKLNRQNSVNVPSLHRQAAKWYLAHNLPQSAFQHAVDGEDVELVAQIFERFVVSKLLGGEIKLVKHWLDSLSENWFASYPMLQFARASFMLVTGQFEAGARYLDEVEKLVLTTSENTGHHHARVFAMRCYIACYQNNLAQAEALAKQALPMLTEEDLDFQAGIYGALGDTYRRNGHWEEAKKSYHKLLDLTHAPAFRVQAVHVYGALADLELRQGHLRTAAGHWKNALAAIQRPENWGSFPLPLIGWVYIRLGELHYEWNELEQAWDYLSQGLERAELGGDIRAVIAGYLVAARLKLTQGDLEKAIEYLEQTRPHLEHAQFAHWMSRFERFQLELWLAQDKLRAAVNWADSKLNDLSFKEKPENIVTQLTMSRVLIIKGDKESMGQALTYLKQLLQTAEHEGQIGIQIEALALQSILDWKGGERVRAMTALEHALRLSEPEGYVRLFADLELPMARVLQEARTRQVMPDYVEKLLSAFTNIPALAPEIDVLPERLTEREEQVLKCLAAGLTNPEIADQLVISYETAKKHARNIYRKLGAHSRTEAVTKARELDLIE